MQHALPQSCAKRRLKRDEQGPLTQSRPTEKNMGGAGRLLTATCTTPVLCETQAKRDEQGPLMQSRPTQETWGCPSLLRSRGWEAADI